MKAYENSFVRYRELAKKLAIGSAVCCAGSVVAVGADSTVQFSLLVMTLALFCAAMYVIIRYCRCPYCGKHIFLGVLKLRSCPACHRDLISGKKTKRK